MKEPCSSNSSKLRNYVRKKNTCIEDEEELVVVVTAGGGEPHFGVTV